MTDQSIVESIRSDPNSRALAALYKHFPMVRSLIRRNGGTTKDAEDIFQEALIIFVKKIRTKNFQLTAQPGSYLFSVSRYLWKDELKRRNRQVPHERPNESNEIEHPVPETAGLKELLEEESRIKLAEQALSELKDRCRELLLLFYHSGHRLKDIATRMGYSSENTAKNQKYKCLEAAKNRLRELKQTLQS